MFCLLVFVTSPDEGITLLHNLVMDRLLLYTDAVLGSLR